MKRNPVLVGLLALAALLICGAPAAAHPGHADEGDEKPRAQGPKLPKALALPAIEGAKPWSDKPLLNDPRRFHIAIMTDRTGGHRPGIWMKAVRRVNLLRPEFVMSVGDLIEGYSEDRDQVEKEWKEFLGFVDEFDMKFFFVAGNHDVSNPVMHDIWREHFGREYYSFDYKGVHFLCLASEDPEARIGDEQLAWLKKDLQESSDARWTLVFLHKPLWVYSERELAAGNPDKTNWQQVQQLLGERPHTVFAGHVHHYVQYERGGMKYYHLATTGGGSRLRGELYGEFDHVTWLTMEKDGPYITHLKLDGILPPDAVTEEGIARFRNFLANTPVEVRPILVETEEGFVGGRIRLQLANGFDAPVRLTGEIEGLPLRGLTQDPMKLVTTAKPAATSTLAVDIQFTEPIEYDQLQQTVLRAKLETLGEERPLVAERVLPVVIDRRHDVAPALENVAVDGKLGEWVELPLATGDEPEIVGEGGRWQGPGDGSVEFRVARDERFVYVAARVKDDRVLPDKDKLELRLDARSMRQRLDDTRLRTGTYGFTATAPDDGETALDVKAYGDAPVFPGAEAAGHRTKDGYELEIAIPVTYLVKNQGRGWETFQLALVLHDADAPDELPVGILWRGTRDYRERNTNFGHFVKAVGE